jgi:hypothetical protein
MHSDYNGIILRAEPVISGIKYSDCDNIHYYLRVIQHTSFANSVSAAKLQV